MDFSAGDSGKIDLSSARMMPVGKFNPNLMFSVSRVIFKYGRAGYTPQEGKLSLPAFVRDGVEKSLNGSLSL